MVAKQYAKPLCVTAFLLVLAAAGWFMVHEKSKLAPTFKAPTAGGPPAAYAVSGLTAPTVLTSDWKAPGPQSAGGKWLFQVFTPPRIYYANGEFVVDTPGIIVPPPPPFGVELVAIKPDHFRLQVVGFYIQNGVAVGTFTNMQTGDTFLGQAGLVVPDLDLTIRDFAIKEAPVPGLPPDNDLTEPAGFANVVDGKTGAVTLLTSQVRVMNGPPFVVFKINAGDRLGELIQDVKEGGTFKVGDSTYTIGETKVSPLQAVVTKVSPAIKDGTPDTRTLTPDSPKANNPASKAPADATKPTDSLKPKTA